MMLRSGVVGVVGLGLAGSLVGCSAPRSGAIGGDGLRSDDVLTTIAFGSCAKEEDPQPIWDSIIAEEPDLFLFIGDNVYADVWVDEETGETVRGAPTVEQMQKAYDLLDAREEWQRLLETVPVLATWDDHDYGLNDAGKEWEIKDEAQDLFLGFFGGSEDAERRDRQGVYHAETFGEAGRRVQVILLDTRYHRDSLDRHPDGRPRGRGPYVPSEDGSKTLLGDEQWAWLQEQLEQPADVRIIASSIQVVAYEHGWETWGNLPHERERLYALIEQTGANGVVFVSGDRHLMEISADADASPYPMWDFTSSGFNWGKSDVDEPNKYRVGPVLREPNFGVIRIDWESGTITLDGLGGEGQDLMTAEIQLSDLQIAD